MIVYGTCVAGDGATYRRSARPFIERVLGGDDRVLHESGDGPGICHVYNRFLDDALQDPACQALVLVQDDVEIIDPEFRAKVLRAVDEAEGGVVGVVGATEVTSLAWWGGQGLGRVFESRGPIYFDRHEGGAEVVDGLLLILGRKAMERLRFDVESFPRFHGYDVDICFQARAAGISVRVADIEVFHRTKGGFGDEEAFFAADRALHCKWADRFPQLTRIERPLPSWLEPFRRARRHVRRAGRRVRDSAIRVVRASRKVLGRAQRSLVHRRLLPLALRTPTYTECLACAAELRTGRVLVRRQDIIDCAECGSGMTWPPPGVDPRSERIWVERYGGERFRRRKVWLSEARIRLDWLEDVRVGTEPVGALLEIGSGSGEFIEAAQERGLIAFGIEPSAAAVEAAQSAGVTIFEGYFSEWRSINADVIIDTIALWHVLEHIPQPIDFLREVRGALRPGGRIAIEVPNWGSTEAQRLRVAWQNSETSDHVVHFTPRGLQELLTEAGFISLMIEPLSEECYSSERAWIRRKNHALMNRHPWPSYDLLRATAVVE